MLDAGGECRDANGEPLGYADDPTDRDGGQDTGGGLNPPRASGDTSTMRKASRAGAPKNHTLTGREKRGSGESPIYLL